MDFKLFNAKVAAIISLLPDYENGLRQDPIDMLYSTGELIKSTTSEFPFNDLPINIRRYFLGGSKMIAYVGLMIIKKESAELIFDVLIAAKLMFEKSFIKEVM